MLFWRMNARPMEGFGYRVDPCEDGRYVVASIGLSDLDGQARSMCLMVDMKASRISAQNGILMVRIMRTLQQEYGVERDGIQWFATDASMAEIDFVHPTYDANGRLRQVARTPLSRSPFGGLFGSDWRSLCHLYPEARGVLELMRINGVQLPVVAT